MRPGLLAACAIGLVIPALACTDDAGSTAPAEPQPDSGASATDAGSAADSAAQGDASTSDAGNADAACAPASSYFGAPRCDCGDFLLCDDFEAPSLDTAVWTLDTEHSTNALDTTQKARGKSSLKVHLEPGAGARVLLSETKTFPAPGNDFWVRAFVYLSAPVPAMHVGMFAASGDLGGGTTEVRLGGDNGNVTPNYAAPSNEYGIFNDLPPTPLPSGRWACFEVHYAGGSNEMHTFMDDKELTEIAVLSSNAPVWTAPPYATLTLGPILFHDETATSAAGFDVWIDSVAVSKTQIGCAR